MPAVDQSTCQAWSEQDINLYNKYPFFLAKTEVEVRPKWETFTKLCKKRKWTPNMGNTMRGVRTNKSPNLRQFAFPQPLTANPSADVMNVVETTTDSILYWHDFESPVMYFLPSFTDFLEHITDTGVDIQEKVVRYEELFLRGMIFHMSPYMFIATGNTMKLVETTPFDGTTEFDPDTMGKTATFLQSMVAQYGAQMTNLTLPSIANGLTKMSVNLGIPPFSGSAMPSGDGKALDQQYAVITHEEAWYQMTFDPYIVNVKNCSLDLVNDSFGGSLFGRAKTKLESLPMYMKADGTFAEPELRVGNNVALNEGETVPNPVYANVAPADGAAATDCSPYAISFLSGNFGYETIDSGPPPAAFTGNKMPRNFPGMQWNGEVYLTKDFLLECVDPITGDVRVKTNSKGRFIKYEGSLTMGIFPKQRRNVIPILHKRQQGL